MSTNAILGTPAAVHAGANKSDRAATIPWYIWCGVLAVTSAGIGLPWDISWHRSIGRDTFWTPAHMLLYACPVLAGIFCGYIIFTTTFGDSQVLKTAGVKVFGFRAPLGVFIAAWGGIAMLTAGPFDNWWHAAYGLDIKIVSPPHVLVLVGLRVIAIGVLFLILAVMNRSAEEGLTNFNSLQRLFLYVGGLIVASMMIQLTDNTTVPQLHLATAYKAMALALPWLFALLSQASRHRWAATWCAAIYTALVVAEILILPLFPAQPALGPVYVAVTHFVPARFPILLVIPAIALDLFWQRTQTWKLWQASLIAGVLFTAVLVAVEWPFADFLLSKWSQNRFFGTMYFAYSSSPFSPFSYEQLRRFHPAPPEWRLWAGLIKAAIYSSIGIWIGLHIGRWMRQVKR
jgi:hypothetical protein